MKHLAAILTFSTGLALAQPVISPGGVQDAASYTDPIAQGSVFVVKGQNLCPPGVVGSGLPYPQSMAGVSITFTPAGGGGAVTTYMVYTYNVDGKEQLAGILPSSTAEGPYDVRVTNANGTSAPVRTSVVRRKFGIITVDGSGRGRAVIQNFISPTQLDLNRFTFGRVGDYTIGPATPGQTLILWGTGLGPTQGIADNVAPGAGQDYRGLADIKLLIGDLEIRPVYAGRAPTLPGADQVNFILPADVPNLPTGCTVPIQVVVDNELSNLATVTIVRPGLDACLHPVFPTATLRKLDQGGTAVAGLFNLLHTNVLATGGETSLDSMQGSFSRYGADQAADVAGLKTARGVCTVTRRVSTLNGIVFGDPPPGLDGGTAINLSGPGQLLASIPRLTGNYYGAGLPANGVRDGAFSMSGTGGADITSMFNATVNAPTRLVWLNRSSISQINRSNGVRVEWSGGTGAQFGRVSPVAVMGISGKPVGGTSANPVYDAQVFICNGEGPEAALTVPASITRQMPETNAANPFGALLVISFTPSDPFGAQTGVLQPIDAGYLSLLYSNARTVSFTGAGYTKR